MEDATPATPSNEALAGTANQILEKVLHYLESAEAFGVEHVPHLVQEVLFFRTTMEATGVFLCFLGVCYGLFAYRWSHRNAEMRLERIDAHDAAVVKMAREKGVSVCSDTEDVIFSFFHYGVPISGGVVFAISLLASFSYVPDLIKVLFAPRLYLLEYFRDLI